MQSNISNWINSEVKNYNVFYINWNNTPEINWLTENTKKSTFKKIIKCKTLGDILVTGDIENNLNMKLTNFKYTSLLKSNLQKCVRRKILDKSLSTAKLMIKTDFLQFIRRLAIIMLEDTTLHESFNVIIWMTAAFPQWKPTKEHINWLLDIVKYLISNEYYDDYSEISPFDYNNNKKIIQDLNPKNRNLIYSMIFRKSFGGMKCDISMIDTLINKWIIRFTKNNNFNCYNQINSNKEKIKNIKTNEIILASIDFHCYPQMINKIRAIHLNYSKDMIKNAIWYHRSRINIRKNLESNDIMDEDKNYIDVWNSIKESVDQISQKYINSL